MPPPHPLFFYPFSSRSFDLRPHLLAAPRLVDGDDRDVPPRQPGEALVKGPMVTRGYHNNPEANRAAFLPGGWFRTGDVLRVQGDLLYLVYRKRVSRVLQPFSLRLQPTPPPWVVDGLVSADQRAQELIKYKGLQVAPDARGRTSPRDLVAHVKARVAPYKQLRGGVVFVDAVPRSPAGKILRRELREMQRRRLQGQSRL